jgi:isocitrate dehydrogenase (NAD+)
VYPIVVVRMAVGDAYGATEHRVGEAGSPDEQALRTERIDRGTCRAVAEYSFRTAAGMRACVYGGPKWTVSALYEGMLKEEMDAAAVRHPDIRYRPTLIDAAYAGLLTEAGDKALVIPALNRDGDCLSDLVLAMFGSIAGAESVLLALDAELDPTVAMAEAPHGTAPSLAGKDVANPMAMLLACAAVLDHAATRGDPSIAGAADASRRDPWCCCRRCPDIRPRGRCLDDRGGRRSTVEAVAARPVVPAGSLCERTGPGHPGRHEGTGRPPPSGAPSLRTCGCLECF